MKGGRLVFIFLCACALVLCAFPTPNPILSHNIKKERVVQPQTSTRVLAPTPSLPSLSSAPSSSTKQSLMPLYIETSPGTMHFGGALSPGGAAAQGLSAASFHNGLYVTPVLDALSSFVEDVTIDTSSLFCNATPPTPDSPTVISAIHTPSLIFSARGCLFSLEVPQSGSWGSPQRVVADVSQFDSLGPAVAVSTGVIVATAQQSGSSLPVVAVFERDGDPTDPLWYLRSILPNINESAEFGGSVSVSTFDFRVTVAVGDPLSDSVFLYVRDVSGYVLSQALRSNVPGSQFGFDVSLDRDTLLVGAPGTTTVAGSYSLFRYSEAANFTKLCSQNAAAPSLFGWSVAQNRPKSQEDTLVALVGAPGNSSALLFQVDLSSSFPVCAAITWIVGSASGRAGESVSVVEQQLLVGDSTYSSESGAVFGTPYCWPGFCLMGMSGCYQCSSVLSCPGGFEYCSANGYLSMTAWVGILIGTLVGCWCCYCVLRRVTAFESEPDWLASIFRRCCCCIYRQRSDSLEVARMPLSQHDEIAQNLQDMSSSEEEDEPLKAYRPPVVDDESGEVQSSLVSPALLGSEEQDPANAGGTPSVPYRRVPVHYFQCKVCFDRPIQTAILPCGHQALCKRCCRRIKDCPICRKPVSSVVRVYHV